MRALIIVGVLGSLGACTMESGGSGLNFGSLADPSATGHDGTDETTAEESGETTGDESGETADEESGETTGDESDTEQTGETGDDELDCPTLGEWSSSAPFATGDDFSHPLPSFAVGDWYYVHAVIDGARVLYSATPEPDGTLGAWQVASGDHGGGPHGFTALAVDDTAYHFRNGHIAEYPLDAQGMMQGDVTLLENDPNAAFGGEKFVWDSAVEVSFGGGARWTFHLGGFSFAPYDYRRAIRRNAVPLGPSFVDVGVDHPAGRPGKAAAHVPMGASTGWIFSGEAGGGGLWRATVQSDGSLTGWDSMSSLPDGTGNERGDLFVVGRALFAVRGSVVFRALVDDAGDLGAWMPMPSLPEDQVDVHWGDAHGEGAAWGRIGDRLYLTGPRAVFHAVLEPGECG